MTKLTWAELSHEQKTEFTRQLKFAGDKNEANYPKHTYQIKDGVCHGWIYMGQVYSKYCPIIKAV
jgi:hypothetical protein